MYEPQSLRVSNTASTLQHFSLFSALHCAMTAVQCAPTMSSSYTLCVIRPQQSGRRFAWAGSSMCGAHSLRGTLSFSLHNRSPLLLRTTRGAQVREDPSPGCVGTVPGPAFAARSITNGSPKRPPCKYLLYRRGLPLDARHDPGRHTVVSHTLGTTVPHTHWSRPRGLDRCVWTPTDWTVVPSTAHTTGQGWECVGGWGWGWRERVGEWAMGDGDEGWRARVGLPPNSKSINCTNAGSLVCPIK